MRKKLIYVYPIVISAAVVLLALLVEKYIIPTGRRAFDYSYHYAEWAIVALCGAAIYLDCRLTALKSRNIALGFEKIVLAIACVILFNNLVWMTSISYLILAMSGYELASGIACLVQKPAPKSGS